VKACEAAEAKLGVTRSSDEEVVCVTENDACCVDAVQAILGCSFGKGNLIYRGTGKMAFSFFCRKSGKKLRAYFKTARPADMGREAYQRYILEAPVDELFAFSEPKFDLPEKARLFDSVVCAECGESAPEYKMRLQDGKTVCLDCFSSYDRGLQ
jgi:formylmethanofuran dehydrogenase subunit E